MNVTWVYRLDPEIARGLESLSTVRARSGDLADSLATGIVEARLERTKGITENDPADLSGVASRDHLVPTLAGGPPVLVRVYRPLGGTATPLPCVVTFFPGGFVFGSIDDTHARNARWCRELGIVVVAVNYRLAPENPYPAAFDDCCSAFCWAVGSATLIGVDASRVALHGTSAGAGLAAAVALRARDEGGPRACFQVLCVPEVDDRLETQSALRFVDTPVWNRRNAIVSWDCYLGAGVRGSAGVPKYAAPARETDFRNLPPAYVSVMELDPLRDEGIEYARSLLDAGVSVELHAFPGTFHGSVRIDGAEVSRREVDELSWVIGKAFRLGARA